jgi:hypothetical protein
MIVTGFNLVQFSTEISTTFNDVIEGFRHNLMYVNYEKPHYLQFQTKNSKKLLNIILADKHIKFLELTINNDKLSWKGHIGNVLKRLSSACYAIRSETPIMAEETLRTVYFAYAHICICICNSPHSLSVFKMQKRIVCIMNKVRHGFLQTTFKKLGILPFYSQYIFSLMTFVVKNMYLYTTNQEIHGVNTRQNTDLHLISVSLTSLTALKEEACFTGMRIFNHLPANVKQLANKIELFKSALKRYLLHSFYSLDEYLNYSGQQILIRIK